MAVGHASCGQQVKLDVKLLYLAGASEDAPWVPVKTYVLYIKKYI